MEVVEVLDLVSDGVFAAVFLWLFIRESNSHEETREAYRNDLREIAGVKADRLIQEKKPTSLP